MFSVTVSNSVMIAHSLAGDIFGPAQRLHGATYVVEITMSRRTLDENGIVADIGRAAALLGDVLAPLSYRNLDDLPEFTGRNTTTEVLAKDIFDRFVAGIREDRLGGDAVDQVARVGVTLREKPDAWAAYEAAIREDG
ncbi:MAG: 6-carboxytetrahydropterin synthase [Rhodospirillaceae bacterium]|jgi:6-pyruvoyl-tetrahydropterin synthase|nr:6-carboxytetrahydropterin synthase [Rhodospirillaceae bacterium]MBT5664620.1 6-carboxytetrahydropterin synthase [Rhodospirillaceae bacterium]MBT5812489.1 6-carboxytetrahydropterin synthase [Rhodospirillaceae bacterium]